MADILRIVDRFMITGRGMVYTVKHKYIKDTNIRMNDIFYDLRHNRFQVVGFEMFRVFSDIEPDEVPWGILMKPLDGIDVCGNFLVRDLVDINFIFCNHPLYKDRVDEDYKEEYQAAGLKHPCALFSYENLENGTLSLYGEKISGLTIYRGWIMKPDMYRKFYSLLEDMGIILINSPEEYEKYHLLPKWYNDVSVCTPDTIWEDTGTLKGAMRMIKDLEGAYIVKDFVKSRKHEWYDACFISNIAKETEAQKIIGNFLDRQGDSLVGGVVLRKYEPLKSIGFHEQSGMPISEEYRVFVYAGKIMVIDNYWSVDKEINITDEEMEWIETLAVKVHSGFMTIDLARKEDGTLIVMELGDGQVSGLQQINPDKFYSLFK